MRGRGGEGPDGRNLLLSSQSQLCRGEGVPHPPCLIGDDPGIGGNEDHREDESGPQAERVDRRLGRRRAWPGQRQMVDGEPAYGTDSKKRQGDDAALRQNRGADRDRSDHQDGKGVLQPAGKEEKHAELQHVEGQIERRVAIAEPGRGPAGQGDVDDRGNRDGGESEPNRQPEAEAEMSEE
jgi:hypothetical protein